LQFTIFSSSTTSATSYPRAPRGSSSMHPAACAAAPAPHPLRAGLPCMGSSLSNGASNCTRVPVKQ
jgi:hypothetical protein